MTRPLRRMTLHLSQIRLTLGLTFMSLFLLFAGLVPEARSRVAAAGRSLQRTYL